MAASFLLRFQECFLTADAAAALGQATTTKVQGEGPDRSGALNLAAVLAPVKTSTAVDTEQPDEWKGSQAAVLPRDPAVAAKETLTLTFVHEEAPRNDDSRQLAGRVLDRCS